jgi:UDP-glucose 4-epimerase
MRALVTGGAGFIGSHICERFAAAGYDVIALDDLSTGKRENVPDGVRLAEVDIVNRTVVDGVFDEVRPVICCHLAAQASVTVSMREPRRDFMVNVEGTLNVVNAAARVGAPVVFSSTGGALYGDAASIPTREETPAEPLAPYGASKLAGEAYVATWGRLNELPNVVLRLGNVYGPRQSPHGEAGVVAIFSSRLLRGETPVVFGDGRQTRDYIHVEDIAQAFFVTATSGRAGTFNVGWGKERTVSELLEVLAAAAGISAEPRFEPLRKGELQRSALDSTRLRALGWSPRIGFEEGLTKTFLTYTPQ